jgi:predicted lipoprotein with Yx(FWY)xxD motif
VTIQQARESSKSISNADPPHDHNEGDFLIIYLDKVNPNLIDRTYSFLKTTQIQKERKMKTTHLILSALVGLVLLATACSPLAAAPTTAPLPTEPPAAVPVTGGTVVNLGRNDTLGSFLVDDKGMTLYLYTKDTPNTSVCYDKCATAWPPLLTTGAPVAGEGVDAVKFGTTNRTDGTVQVTHNGWPLYYYEKDKAPGDVVGQDVGGVWYVVSAAGDKVTTP